MAQGIDDLGYDCVGKVGFVEDRSGVLRKQPAVVRGQTYGGVALVDELEQSGQMVIVGGGSPRKMVAPFRSFRDIVPDPLSQTIVFISGVVDWQKAPVFRVQKEQQPVKEGQCRLAHLGKFPAGGFGQSSYQVGKDLIEHRAGKVLRYPFLIAAALGQGGFQVGDRCALPRGEGLPAEQEVEQAEVVVGTGFQCSSQIHLKVTGGPGAGSVVVKAPHLAVGKNPPPDSAIGYRVRSTEIPEDLAVRGACLHLIAWVPAVQGKS